MSPGLLGGCGASAEGDALGRRGKGQDCVAPASDATVLSLGGVGRGGVHRDPSLGVFPKVGGLKSGRRFWLQVKIHTHPLTDIHSCHTHKHTHTHTSPQTRFLRDKLSRKGIFN